MVRKFTTVIQHNEFSLHLMTKWRDEVDFFKFTDSHTELTQLSKSILEEIGSPPGTKQHYNHNGVRNMAYMFLCLCESFRLAFGNLLVTENIRNTVRDMQAWLGLHITNYDDGTWSQNDPYTHFVKLTRQKENT